MKLLAEYTGRGRGGLVSQISNVSLPSSEATLVIKTRGSFGEHDDKVKLRKVSLMIFPAGTVMFQVQLELVGKFAGKLGLEKNPLDATRLSPGETHGLHATITTKETATVETIQAETIV